jgi:hypothetical protein
VTHPLARLLEVLGWLPRHEPPRDEAALEATRRTLDAAEQRVARLYEAQTMPWRPSAQSEAIREP